MFLILSHFDGEFGPKVFLKAPDALDKDNLKLKQIPLLMDLNHKGFFLHFFDGFKSLNYHFEIDSQYARGNIEMLLISILISEEVTDINIDLARELLESFVEEFVQISDAYKAFYLKSRKYEGEQEKFKEVKDLFFSFYKSFKPAVEALRIAELRYQILFKAARDAILIINQNSGIIIDANEQAEKLLEQPIEDINGLNAKNLWNKYEIEMVQVRNKDGLRTKYESFMEEVLKQIKLIKKGENPLPIVLKIKTSTDKYNLLEVNANRILMGSEVLLQFILRDITEREQSKEALAKAYEEIKESEIKFHLAYDRESFFKDLFTHDFNILIDNILFSVQQYSKFITDKTKTKYRDYVIEKIKGQCIWGAKSISNIKKLEQIEDKGKFLRNMDVGETIKRVISNVTNHFQDKDIKLEIEALNESLIVQANDFLSEVFENVLINKIIFNENQNVNILVKTFKEKRNFSKYIRIEFIDRSTGEINVQKKEILDKIYDENEYNKGIGLGLLFNSLAINSFNGQTWDENRVRKDNTKVNVYIILIPEVL